MIAQGKRTETSAALGYYLFGFQPFAISQPQRGCDLPVLGLCRAVCEQLGNAATREQMADLIAFLLLPP